MGLLTPKKGAAAPTGRIKPSRAEALMAATRELAADQLPDPHTMTAIEGAGDTDRAPRDDRRPPDAAPAPDRVTGAARDAAPTDPAGAGVDVGGGAHPTPTVRTVRVEDVRPSPFQPKGRPSGVAVDAVRRAIADAGSLAALVGPEGSTTFGRLAPEAARLAELAADVAAHGLKVPIEVRAADGGYECLSGHRRLAAARLAGQETVPVLDCGVLSNAAAAATVLRGNLHRENFTTWQEAVLITDVQERRRHDGFRDNVRTLGAVMGWSHGKVNMLLRIRRALEPAFLDRAAAEVGLPTADLEERLARAPYRDLERVTADPDPTTRVAVVRRILGIADPAARSDASAPVCVHRPKRGGGFLLEVRAPVESLGASDAAHLREVLEAQLARVKARLATVGTSGTA